MTTGAHLISDHLAWMRAAGKAASAESRKTVLLRLDRHLSLGLAWASDEEIIAFLGRSKRDGRLLAANTRATEWMHITQFYLWAVAAGRLGLDPTEGMPRPKGRPRTPKPVHDEELAQLLRDLPTRMIVWALLAAYAGLRCCEIAALHTDDMSERGINVHGKGDHDRWVPMHPAIWAVAKHLPPGPVARHYTTGKPATATYVSNAFRNQAQRRLRMQKVSLHRLRHWFGTTALRGCRNVRTVQELLGHANVANTAIYTLILSEERDAAVAALPSLASAS